jgi:hypothetical protein
MKNSNLKKLIFTAFSIAIFFIACKDKEIFYDNNYAITSLFACGSTGDTKDIPTTKLIFTVNDDNLVLTANDIKINAGFSVIKGDLKKNTDTMTYELHITPGSYGTIRVGLNPYQGFTGWNAKDAYVYSDWHFSGTSNLTITGCHYSIVVNSLTIPQTIANLPVTTIGANAFYYKNLISVNIPESVTSIETSAFKGNKLTTITIPKNVIYLSGFENNLLSSITIPAGVLTIGSYAFSDNLLDNSNTIPAGVLTIGSYAFFDNSFGSITIPDSVTYIDSYAFSNNPLTIIKIGYDVELGISAFGNGFEEVYNTDNEKAGGTYTRTSTSSKTWKKL